MTIIVVGAGINGLTAALELRERGNEVTLIDPGPLPHPLAASTDISKAVRAAYGAEELYTELAERAIEIWPQWNAVFGQDFYHETGFLCMRRTEMQPGDFEYESLKVLERRGREVERLDSAQLQAKYPAWNAKNYEDGIFEARAGYVQSSRVIAALIPKTKEIGVQWREARFMQLHETDAGVNGVILSDGEKVLGDRVLLAAGAWTPELLPETRAYFRTTGQPVFHLQPTRTELFAPDYFPVFGADISTTGYYGFPINRDGIVKIANHGPGREMPPDATERKVTPEETERLREFLRQTFPALLDAPIVHTRICLYCDTADGNFWIAADPKRPGLVLATGDSGHGFKFAPVLGRVIADAVEDRTNPFLEKFRWRPDAKASGKEAARFSPERVV